MAIGQNFYAEDDDGSRALSSLLNSQAQASNLSGQEAAQRADPFYKYKPAVAESLSNLLSNPGDVATSPYYKFAMDQGIEAVTRANKGVNSGKYLSELQKFGTGYAGQQFGSLASLYNNILGGSATGGAQMLMGGFGRGQDQQAMAAAGKAAAAAQRQQQSGGGQQPSNLDALLQRYGMGGGGGNPNGFGSLSSFTGPGGTPWNGGYGPDHTWAGVNPYNAYGTFLDDGTYSPIQGGGSGYYTVNDPYSYDTFGGGYTASPYDTSYTEPTYDYGGYEDYGYEY